MKHKFKLGDRVRVNSKAAGGSHRIPSYIKGKVGRIAKCYGKVENPLDHRGVYSPLYSVEFNVSDLFAGGVEQRDKIHADVHEDSLELVRGTR